MGHCAWPTPHNMDPAIKLPTNRSTRFKSLRKAPTGIRGLDEITGGGLPAGRPTLVCGGAGCGKTLLGMEFLVRGATEFGEPGVFMAFEETSEAISGAFQEYMRNTTPSSEIPHLAWLGLSVFALSAAMLLPTALVIAYRVL